MKIGKGPKRFGGPSKEFARRKALEEGTPIASVRPDEVRATGDVMLFLDDERQTPKGWTLARDPAALYALLDAPHVSERVTMISLDWHLADGETGDAVAEHLAERLADQTFLPLLEGIMLHSSVPEKARGMAKTIIDAIRTHGRDDIGVVHHTW